MPENKQVSPFTFYTMKIEIRKPYYIIPKNKKYKVLT